MRGDWRNPGTAQVAIFVVIGVLAFHWAYPLIDLGFVLAIAAVVGVLLYFVRTAFDQRRVGGPRRDPRFAAPVDVLDGDQHDLVGLRLALERTVAIPALASLDVALRGSEVGKAARVARVLLAHRGTWRFAGLDATRPLPAARASEVFDRWSADVRKRFGAAPRGEGDAFRHDSLIVISLHVASAGRMPEVDVNDPEAAAHVLGSLRDHSETWATRVDLFSADRGFTAAELRAADPTLIELGGNGDTRAPSFMRLPRRGP